MASKMFVPSITRPLPHTSHDLQHLLFDNNAQPEACLELT